MKKFHLTQSGLEKFKQELEQLKAKRPQITEAIASAREQGDLSENSEYQTAKEEQEILESRILEIENILKNVTLINSSSQQATNIVELGSRVNLKNSENSEKIVFDIVGTVEANPFEGKISDESPVGQRLIGKTVGEEVSLPNPEGEIICKVISIE